MASSGLDAGCYVYRPDEASTSIRPSINTPDASSTFSNAQVEAFHRVWQPVNATLQKVLSDSDASAVTAICSYLAALEPKTEDRIPAGLITTSTAGSLFSKVKSEANKDILFISVPAAQCNNLKAVLKCITTSVTRPVETDVRLLNYDLDILQLFMDDQHYEKVVLYFGNAESLHGGVLSDLVDVLDSYRTRIPLALLFETAVSVDLFQEKLTRRALRQLRGTTFATASASEVVERIFESLVTDTSHRLQMGANLATMLMDRQSEQMQSASAFVEEIKYMYMVHFHRNQLCLLLDAESETESASNELLEAARQAKSFKAHVDDLKKKKASKQANELLKSNSAMAKLLYKGFGETVSEVKEGLVAASVIKAIYEHASPKVASPWSRVYIQAMSGQLADSPLETAEDSLQAMPSDKMLSLLTKFHAWDREIFASLLSELTELLAKHEVTDEPLRTQHDKIHETTRATVVAKRISLSKSKATLSRGDQEYTDFVDKVQQEVVDFLGQRIANPRTLLFNEAFVFDLRVPIREAFAPRPRYALEHALTVPGAYLACECCDADQRVLNASQPATAILYQLYLESGVIVNIADLWSAFDAIISSEDPENTDDTETRAEYKMALFYRALAELKYLGMVKSSRKRADHLVKMKFIGL